MADIEPLEFGDADQPPHIVPDHKASEKLDPSPGFRGRLGKNRFGADKKPPMEDLGKTDRVPYKPGMFVKPLEEMYGGFAMVLMPINPAVGSALAMQARPCAEAWDRLAHENEAVRKMLRNMLTASATTAVIVAHVPIAMAIAMQFPFVQEKVAARFGDQVEDELREHTEGG